MAQRHGRERRGFTTILQGLKCNLGAANFYLSATVADGLVLTQSVKEKKKSFVSFEMHTMAAVAFRMFALRIKPSCFNGCLSVERGRERRELGNREGTDGM